MRAGEEDHAPQSLSHAHVYCLVCRPISLHLSAYEHTAGVTGDEGVLYIVDQAATIQAAYSLDAVRSRCLGRGTSGCHSAQRTPLHKWAATALSVGVQEKNSTETAMLRVGLWSDFLTSADARKVTLLGLLDLSAAFDCVDHDILLQQLDVVFGLTDTALDWIRSFVSGRTQQVSYHSRLSSPQSVLFGVPHGSVLGPLLYMLYTAELSKSSLATVYGKLTTEMVRVLITRMIFHQLY